MNWETFIASILASGVLAALITEGLNYKTQIRAIKESGIYAKRAEILDELMSRMEDVGHQIQQIQWSLLEDISTEHATKEKVANSYANFSEYFYRHKHYLPKRLSDEINKFCLIYHHQFAIFERDKEIKKVKLSWPEFEKRMLEGASNLNQQKEKIIDEFRKIIGVS